MELTESLKVAKKYGVRGYRFAKARWKLCLTLFLAFALTLMVMSTIVYNTKQMRKGYGYVSVLGTDFLGTYSDYDGYWWVYETYYKGINRATLVGAWIEAEGAGYQYYAVEIYPLYNTIGIVYAVLDGEELELTVHIIYKTPNGNMNEYIAIIYAYGGYTWMD